MSTSDTQGHSLFSAARPGTAPPVLKLEHDATSARVQLSIEPGLPWFDGHFDSRPILPGVVQVHWAGLALEQLFGICGEFAGAENVKFQNVIEPPRVVDLGLEFDSSKKRGRFVYTSQGCEHSRGLLQYR